MAEKQPKRKSELSDRGSPRTYRFHPKLWEQFEDECGANLYNPRAIIEAAVLHWLEMNDVDRKKVALRRRDWEENR